MEIKTRKNNYNHDVIDCPFCSYWCFIREQRRFPQDRLRDLIRHFNNMAKNEALAYFLDNKSKIPHLEYFVEHSKEQEIAPVVKKRIYDDDLKLKMT